MSRYRITGAARVAGIAGNPVAHSLSPVIHNAWLAAGDIDGAYVPFAPADETGFEALAELATKAGVEGTAFRIQAPLQNMTKADLLREGTRLGLDLGLSWSCYDPAPNDVHCGLCDSCRLRHKGFEDAGVSDPTVYAVTPPAP